MKFDQDQTKPYGHVKNDPSIVFQSREDATEWMRQNHGSVVVVTNPSRESRIETDVYIDIVGELLGVWDRFAEEVEDGSYTVAEVAKALSTINLEEKWLEAAKEMGLEGEQP